MRACLFMVRVLKMRRFGWLGADISLMRKIQFPAAKI